MRAERIQAIPERGYSFDTETFRIQPGLTAPPVVCGSLAAYTPGEQGGTFATEILDRRAAVDAFIALLEDADAVISGANVSFDLLVTAIAAAAIYQRDLMPLIFRAFAGNMTSADYAADSRIYDVQIAEQLNAIAEGTLLRDPRTGGPLTNPETGKQAGYSLAVCLDLNTGRKDAKVNDEWRENYGQLADVPMASWPPAALQYPRDDVHNNHTVTLCQIGTIARALPAGHRWGDSGHCQDCGLSEQLLGTCLARKPHRNLHDLANQVWTAFAMALGASWGFHVNQASVDIIEAEALRGHVEAEEPFVREGLLRRKPDGTTSQDLAATKERVARAYGVDVNSKCAVCAGAGEVLSPNAKPVRCRTCKPTMKRPVDLACPDCHGLGTKTYGPTINCKPCQATGFDLSTAPHLPRTDKDGVAYGRDVLNESGDESLINLAEHNEDQKILSVYVPYLRQGRACVQCGAHGTDKSPHAEGCTSRTYRDIPLTLRPNVLLETGRTSYSGVIQLFPRKAGFKNDLEQFVPSLRETIEARPGYVFSSEDFTAGELVTHAQSCLWTVGQSDLARALLLGVDPHSALGATVLGINYAQFSKYNKQHANERQSAKCFHPDTEALTRRGWVRIGDLAQDDDVAAAIPTAAGITIEWQRPTNLTRRPSPGHLVHLRNEGMDLRVTDDHRMLVRGGTGKWSVVAPAEVARARGWFNAGRCVAGTWQPDERLLRLAVAVQADGAFSHDQIRFGFVKERKIERLRQLLRAGEYQEYVATGNTSTGTVTWFVLRPGLAAALREFLDERKQFTWRWLELAPALRDVVLDEAEHWDGHRSAHWRAYQFSSTQRQSVDVLQALATITNRKTRAVNRGRELEHHNDVWTLTVRAKPDTRGDNLAAHTVAYDGDVVCLSVPASFVVVRDGGVPVVVGQCFNFGKPGGMGDAKLVLQQRKQGPDTPHPSGTALLKVAGGNLVRGYRGLRFCILMGRADVCGKLPDGRDNKVNEWGRRGRERPIPPTCRACLECASELGGYWRQQWPENEDYFRFVSDCVDNGQEITGAMLERWPHLRDVFREGQRLNPGEVMQHVSGRIRTVTTPGTESPFCAAANGFFQGLLADVAKSALRRIVWECYDRTVRVPDMLHPNSIRSQFAGLESPLYGSRIIVFQHDEVIGEHPEAIAHEAATRISEIMRDSLRWYCVDVADAAKAEPTLMRAWHKDAEKTLDANGRLIPWEPPA